MIKEEGWGVWDFVTVTLTSLTSILNPIKSKQLWITFNSEISNVRKQEWIRNQRTNVWYNSDKKMYDTMGLIKNTGKLMLRKTNA